MTTVYCDHDSDVFLGACERCSKSSLEEAPPLTSGRVEGVAGRHSDRSKLPSSAPFVKHKHCGLAVRQTSRSRNRQKLRSILKERWDEMSI